MDKLSVTLRLAKALERMTDVWFGPSDVAGAIAKALAVTDTPAMVVQYDGVNGLRIDGDRTIGIAQAINDLLRAEVVEVGQVRAALHDTLRGSFGFQGGVIIFWQIGGQLRLNVVGFAEAMRSAVLN